MEPDSSNLEFNFSKHSYEVDFTKIERISYKVQSILGVENYQLDVNFISPNEIQDLNREYRSKDKSTDVLSFPQHEFAESLTCEAPGETVQQDGPPLLLGDLAISLEDAYANAQSIGQDLDREVCFLIVHGILHLCGHDHMETEEEAIMLKQQRQIMDALEDSEPPPRIWAQCARLKS